MENDSQEKLIDRYDKLPEDVQSAIFSSESAEIIQKIGQDYKLNIRQVGILADEAGLLMLGVNSPKEFVQNLNKRLEVDKDTVQKIVREINTRIFAKIRESLRKIHGISEEKKDETGTEKGGAEEKGERGEIEDTSPMAHIIKPRTAPFVVSQKKPETGEISAPAEETPLPAEDTPILPGKKQESATSQPNQKDLGKVGIVEERKKEEGFRSKPSFTEIKLPEETTPQKEPPKKPIYKGGTDPYREPVE